jgi:hypothetical protein
MHLWSRITQFEPKTDGQRVIHGQVLDSFNKLVEFSAAAHRSGELCRTGNSVGRRPRRGRSFDLRVVLIQNSEFVGTRPPDHLAYDDDRFIGVLHRDNQSSL